MATSSQHSIYYVKETLYGTTPSSPVLKQLRITGTTLGTTKGTHLSEELRSDRQIKELKHGVAQSGGDLSFELSYGNLDDLLEAALCGNWTEDTEDTTGEVFLLKAGTVRRSFSMVREYGDLGAAEKRHIFTGVEFNTLSLTFPTDGYITGSLGAIGRPLTVGSPAGAQYGQPAEGELFTTFSGFIKEGGDEMAIITELTLTLENGITPRFSIAQSGKAIKEGAIGRSNVTGQVTAYFESHALLEKFLNEGNSSMEIQVSVNGRSYTLLLPKIKYTGGQADTSGQGDITISLPFQGLLGGDEETNLLVTRKQPTPPAGQ